MQKLPEMSCRWLASNAAKALFAGVSVAALLSMGTVAANAEDAVTMKQIRELKAQLRMLEKRVDAQNKVIHTTRASLNRSAAPYSPPLPWDKKFHLNGITVTPGGFVSLDGFWRNHNEGADTTGTFGSMPTYNSPNSHMQELRFSARQTRLSLLAEGAVNPGLIVSGYTEMDFLGAGSNSNQVYSNSYVPRLRHAYITADWNDVGVHLLAGQDWSFLALYSNSLKPRTEALPAPGIDVGQIVGTIGPRQPGIRITKDLPEHFAVGIAAEMPQTTIGGCGSPLTNLTTGAAGSPTTAVLPSGGTVTCLQQQSPTDSVNPIGNFSFNHIPDIITKAAWDPTFQGHKLHFEAMALYTDLYDSVTYNSGLANASNSRFDTAGWGAGGGFVAEVIPKWIDIRGQAMIGRGIGRYGASSLTGASFYTNGALQPLPEIMYIAGATLHATPQLDLYLYGGQERILNAEHNPLLGTTQFQSNTASNAGCYTIGGVCNSPTEQVWEVTAGAWYKAYQGAFGSLRLGAQYAYVNRSLFASPVAAGGLPAYSGSPHFTNQTAFLSLRYFPFDAPPPAPALVSKY